MRRISSILATCAILAFTVGCSAPELAIAPLPTPYETEDPIERLPVVALNETSEPASASTAIAAIIPQATRQSSPPARKPSPATESQQSVPAPKPSPARESLPSAPQPAAAPDSPPEPSRREPQPAAATPVTAPSPDFEAASRELTPFGRSCPPEQPIKGAVDEQGSKRYYVPSGPDYAKITPSTCFPTVQEAQAAGFRPAPQ